MDDQVAVPTDAELKKLLDQFVCVRLVQMWGIDLSQFQFDFALTWAVFYMNADATIYGRYGSRSAMRKQSARDISLAGFKESIRGALDLHKRYTLDRQAGLREVAGKQTKYAPQWDRPEKIPVLAKNKRLARKFSALAEDRSGRDHGVGCIHCHMVSNHELLSLRLQANRSPSGWSGPTRCPARLACRWTRRSGRQCGASTRDPRRRRPA